MSPAQTSRWVLVVLSTGLAYLALFLVNEYALAFTKFAGGVNWVYLPSGLRLTLVLVLGWPAAVGIAWSSVLVSAWPQTSPLWPHALVTGCISGLAPWLCLLVARRWLRIRDDLSGLDVRSLLGMAVLFAVVCAGMHQLWYGATQPPQDRMLQFTVMALGDLAGTLVMLYLGKGLLHLLHLLAPKG